MSKASHQHGLAFSSNVTILITYLKCDSREMPKSRQVNSGTLVIMECSAKISWANCVECKRWRAIKSENESHKIFILWYKDGKLLHIPKHESDLVLDPLNFKSNKYALIHDSNLFIFSAMLGRGNKSDNGVYNCKLLSLFYFKSISILLKLK